MVRKLPGWPGAPLALASSVVFGVSTPIAKLLLGEGISPWLLAGVLYLGSGLGLGVVQIGRRILGLPSTEAPFGPPISGGLRLSCSAMA